MMAYPQQSLEARTWTPVLDRARIEFIREYLVDLVAERAAERAGLRPEDGLRFLHEKPVKAAIELAKLNRGARIDLEPDYVLRRWKQVLEADPRELIEHWRVPCRHCWGIDHQRQFTEIELREELQLFRRAHLAGLNREKFPLTSLTDIFYSQKHAAWEAGKRGEEPPPFDELGGSGYTINRAPCRGPDYVEFLAEAARLMGVTVSAVEANGDHTCPHCFGHGLGYVYLHDTRELSPNAMALFLGIRQKNGEIEIVTRDKGAIEALVAKHLGVVVEREERRRMGADGSVEVTEVRRVIVERGQVVDESELRPTNALVVGAEVEVVEGEEGDERNGRGHAGGPGVPAVTRSSPV